MIFYFAVLKVKTAVNKILNFAIKIRLDETRHGVLSTETQVLDLETSGVIWTYYSIRHHYCVNFLLLFESRRKERLKSIDKKEKLEAIT